MSKIFLPIVVGPTASGKTKLGVELAKLNDGEVVSCDSMQIYKGMDIATAKPTADEMQNIPHHLISVIEPNIRFSVADYKKLADNEGNVIFGGRLGEYKYYDMDAVVIRALDVVSAEL